MCVWLLSAAFHSRRAEFFSRPTFLHTHIMNRTGPFNQFLFFMHVFFGRQTKKKQMQKEPEANERSQSVSPHTFIRIQSHIELVCCCVVAAGFGLNDTVSIPYLLRFSIKILGYILISLFDIL